MDTVRNVNCQRTASWTVRMVENRKPTALQAVIEETHGYVNVKSKPVLAISEIW